MMLDGRFDRRHVVFLCAFLVTAVLAVQLVAVTAWTADNANAGPSVVILQLSNDGDTNWAVADLQKRLSEFISDDPFFVDRVVVKKTSDPYIAETLDAQIVIYMSHGGPIGIVTGNHLTSWRRMAQIVANSRAGMHLFAACYSRDLIKYGDDESAKKLYTVPGARPAEVTNVEITTTVMLALGINADSAERYRTSELTKAKELVETGQSIHIMDFEQIILNEIENIDGNYSNTYTDTHRVYRYSEEELLTGVLGYAELPSYTQQMISLYFRAYLDDMYQVVILPFYDCRVTYIRNYYFEAQWIIDDLNLLAPAGDSMSLAPPANPSQISPTYVIAAGQTGGHWEFGEDIFCGGTYSGWVSLGDYAIYHYILNINVTASGPTIDSAGKTEINSLSLRAISPKGTYVMNQKVDGVWGEPVVGRDPARTGGLWTDSATRVDYEYTSSVLPIPFPSSTGVISSTGDYIQVTSIPSSQGWHGPTFIQTLPSYFKIIDLGSFSANLSLVHGGIGARESVTSVSLYDDSMKIVLSLMIIDNSPNQLVFFRGSYYESDGSPHSVSSQTFSGDTNGIVTMRYDPQVGLYVKFPGEIEDPLVTNEEISVDRLIKYVAIQSYRYGSTAEHDERIYSVRLSYAGSEYTVFHDNANDMNAFRQDPSFSNGVLEVPTGESYMTWSSIDAGSGWHGPQYVHVLDRPFRLFQLSEFSVLGELIQGAGSQMGITSIALLDDSGERVIAIEWGDDASGWTDGWFRAVFYLQTGQEYSRYLWYGEDSFAVTISTWWDSATGQGSIYTKRGDLPYQYLVHSVYNASRVVKSVVVEGLRYGSNPLLAMRIHDIAVVADPNRRLHDEPEPEVADGTPLGLEDTVDADTIQSVDLTISDLISAITSVWQLVNFWPKLFIGLVLLGDVIYDILVSGDLIGNTEVHRMQVHVLASDVYTDGEIGAQIDLSSNNILRGLVELGKWAGPVILAFTLNFLRACSWDMMQFTAGVFLWMLGFILYISFVFWTYDNGYSNSWECAFMMCELLLLLLIGTSLLQSLTGSFRILWLMYTNPAFLVFFAVVSRMDAVDLLRVFHLGWNFPIILIEFIALVVTSFFLGYWFMVAMQGL